MSIYLYKSLYKDYSLLDELTSTNKQVAGFIFYQNNCIYKCDSKGLGPLKYSLDVQFIIDIPDPVYKHIIINKLLEQYTLDSAVFPTFISNRATVSQRATLGIGNIIYAGARVDSGVTIKNFNSIQDGSHIKSNSTLGSYNAVYRAFIGHNVAIGDNNILKPQCVIPSRTILGTTNTVDCGEVVTSDMRNNERFSSGIIQANDNLF
jgi:acetyltransferase-like isoleucine patch superfamily enzyme